MATPLTKEQARAIARILYAVHQRRAARAAGTVTPAKSPGRQERPPSHT